MQNVAFRKMKGGLFTVPFAKVHFITGGEAGYGLPLHYPSQNIIWPAVKMQALTVKSLPVHI